MVAGAHSQHWLKTWAVWAVLETRELAHELLVDLEDVRPGSGTDCPAVDSGGGVPSGPRRDGGTKRGLTRD